MSLKLVLASSSSVASAVVLVTTFDLSVVVVSMFELPVAVVTTFDLSVVVVTMFELLVAVVTAFDLPVIDAASVSDSSV